jgi:hypothetical protein
LEPFHSLGGRAHSQHPPMGACFSSYRSRTAGDPARKTWIGRPMRAHLDSYVVDVLFAMRSPWSSAIAQRLRRLTASAFDPYRPELHYMRGPGPKWREKNKSA